MYYLWNIAGNNLSDCTAIYYSLHNVVVELILSQSYPSLLRHCHLVSVVERWFHMTY